MKLVIQRVKRAQVKKVKSRKVVGKIGQGLLVLLGVKKGDSKEDAALLAEKLIKLRVMADKNNKMNLTVGAVGGEILVVSQFTLYADTSGGNRPSFIAASTPNEARKVYEHFLTKLRQKTTRVATGSFGDYMEIEAELDGPVTIIIDSEE